MTSRSGSTKNLARTYWREHVVQNLFGFKLDVKSVPEALATSIRILLMFSIVLEHSRALIPTFLKRFV